MVGYWAEVRLLGGITLFNRSMEWSEEKGEPEPNAYWDSWHFKVVYRISQLRDKQQHKLLRFLTSQDTSTVGTCPPPLLTTKRNRNHIAMVDAISVYKVYRDIWERFALPASVLA